MRHDVVEREAVPVVYAAAAGTWEDVAGAAGRAFARLEAAIPPHGSPGGSDPLASAQRWRAS
jgi:hypothetical protein